MNTGAIILYFFLLIPIFYAGIKLIAEPRRLKDIKGALEDGYLKRFNGAVIEYFREEENIHRIVMNAPFYPNGESDPEFEFKEINGLRRTVLYQIPIHNDPVPVYNFYKEEMELAGFKIFYSDYGNEKLGKPRDWYKQIFVTGKNLFVWSDLSRIMQGRLLCYFSGEKEENGEKVYLSLFAVNHFRNNKRTGVFIFLSRENN